MKRSIVILTVLVFYSSLVFCGTNDQAPVRQKSVIEGVVLGYVSTLGILIPGTFGWGNIYAEDYAGFWILNTGGSICTVCTWIEIIRDLSSTSPDPKISPFGYIGVFGSLGFSIASMIWGGAAVLEYNNNQKKQNMRLFLIPQKDGLEFHLAYNF